MPLLVLLVLVVRPVLPCSAGSSARVVNRFGLADFSRSAVLKLVVGVGWVKPRAAMREPEMRTTLLPSLLAGAVPAVGTGSVAASVAAVPVLSIAVCGAAAGVTAAGSLGACWAWAMPSVQQALLHAGRVGGLQ